MGTKLSLCINKKKCFGNLFRACSGYPLETFITIGCTLAVCLCKVGGWSHSIVAYCVLGPHMVLIFSSAVFLCCTEGRRGLEGEEPRDEVRETKNSKHAVQKSVI